MSKKYKIPLITIVVILILFISLAVFLNITSKSKNKNPVVSSSIVDTMDEFGYTLDDRDSELVKNLFKELKEVLTAEEINYEEYAKLISQMFAVDLLSIDNKVNKYDIGSLEFLYENEIEMFKNKVLNTLYDYVEDNSYDERKQELPMVKEVSVESIDNLTYKIEEESKESYEVVLKLTYEKDLGYDEDIKITVVKDEKKLYVIGYTTDF